MNKFKIIAICVLVGLILGFISASTFLAHSWVALIVWGLIGLVSGYLINDREIAIISGALYGFLLTLSFLIFGFHGAGNKFISFIGLSIILSLIGAICGIVLFQIGNLIKEKLYQKKNVK